MKDYFAPVPREWGYPAFIDELKPLIEQAKAFDHHARKHDSEAFRAWRYKVSSLCTRISRTHLDSDTRVDERPFSGVPYGKLSAKDVFDRDLNDTLVELDHMVEQFVKFGEPKTRLRVTPKTKTADAPSVQEPQEPIKAPTVVEPEWPSKDKLTLHWLFKNMPASAWAWVGVFLVGAFGVGTTVGSWPVVQKWLEPASTTQVKPKP
jgi:hypothetical protein